MPSTDPSNPRRSTPFRVGLLGTGYIASWHADALKAVKGATLSAVCDRNIALARSFASKCKLPEDRAFASVEAMLSAPGPKLDVVHVLLPPEHHAPAAEALIDAGVHVFLEKPMGVSAAECAGLVAKAEAKGVALAVNHNFLFAPAYERLRADVRSGRIGRLDRIDLTWHRPLGQLQGGPFDIWMLRDPANILLEIGPHLVSALLDLAGDRGRELEPMTARAGNPATLPGGGTFYRRWQVDAGGDALAASLSLAFGPGFDEHAARARGALAVGAADLERDVYVLREHTPAGMDADRYRRSLAEAGALKAQARRTLASYALSKFKIVKVGSPYGASMVGAMRRLYEDLAAGRPVDRRLSGAFGAEVVATCERLGREGVEAARAKGPAAVATAPPAAPAVAAPSSRPEILVLGATGFIGRALVRRLADAGRPVRILARNPGRIPDELRREGVEVAIGDLSRPEDVDRALEGITGVVHLARAMVKQWSEYLEQDVAVTRRLAEACLARGVRRFVYTGTIDSYYAGAKAGTITEETPLDPLIARRNYYARAKATSEAELLEMHRDRGLPLVIARPGIVIGPGGSPFHWGVGMWSYQAVCQLWGDGATPLPLVLVDDVADGLIACLDVPGIEGESFNLCADSGVTARGYIKALDAAAGSAHQVHAVPIRKYYLNDMAKWVVKCAVGHPDRHRRPAYRDWESRSQRARFDCSKARRVLGWKPVDDPEEMLRRGVAEPTAEALR